MEIVSGSFIKDSGVQRGDSVGAKIGSQLYVISVSSHLKKTPDWMRSPRGVLTDDPGWELGVGCRNRG